MRSIYLRGLLVAGLLFLALPATAGEPPAGPATRTITDSAGRHVTVPARIRTVYAAGPPAEVVLYTLAPDRLAGWNRPLSAEQKAYLPERYHGLPILGRLTGRGGTANVEMVLAVRPDVIVDVGVLSPTYASLADRVQQQTGIPYVLVDGSLATTDRTYQLLGSLLDEAARAHELATAFRETADRGRQAMVRVPPAGRPRLYYAAGPKGLETAAPGSIHVEVLDLLGVANVAAASTGPAARGSVSLEQVLRWRPDTIVTVDEQFYRGVFADPLWQDLEAVKARRVYLAPRVPYPWIDFPPGVNRIIGIRWLAGLFSPEAYPEDLARDIRAFYSRFYHREPTPPQVEALLRTARGPSR